jgi:hypothetical protein
MKNIIIITAIAAAMLAGCTQPSGHPRIYVREEGRASFEQRLEEIEWVRQAFDKLKAGVDPYVIRHQTDPEWIVSRLQMYWDNHYQRVYVKGNVFDHGTGFAPVPTVKFAGHRDGATDYLMPSLEETLPYMDAKGMYLQNSKKEGKPWEWVHPSRTGRMIGPMNERIMRMAATSAFLYWKTGETDYARFASDIFMTYIRGMHHRREPFALEDYTNSHLMGLATFEVILDNIIPQLAICYDFLHDYLRKNNEDMDMITSVLKRFADQEIAYGVPDNNWNIFQARFVAYIALALEHNSAYRDGKGREYYLNEIIHNTTIRQFALTEVMLDVYDRQTFLWPESATYSMSVCNDMLDIVALIDNAESNHIADSFPILQHAAPALVHYLMPNGRVTAFGDAKYAPLNPHPLEMLISIYRKYGDRDAEAALTSILKQVIAEGSYDRSSNSGLFPLFNYVDTLMSTPPPGYDHVMKDMYHTPNTSWLMQRNGRNPQTGVALTLTGAYGNHAHANGISIEMYAKGLIIAPDASNGETYGTIDHREYYSRFPAHNTVIVDGQSDYATMRSYAPYSLLAAYPHHGENLAHTQDKITFARAAMIEPRTNARQERISGIIRHSSDQAYIFDIFRSARLDRKDAKHEYIHHSIGSNIEITTADGSPVRMMPTQELSSASGDLKGYDYFTDKQSATLSADFRARFNIPLDSSDDVAVDAWMQGFPERTVYTVSSPRSNAFLKGSIPSELIGKNLPTLILRQRGEAWTRPFAAIYSTHSSTEDPSIQTVTFSSSANTQAAIVRARNQTDHILYPTDESQPASFRNITFTGALGILSESSGTLLQLFIGHGRMMEYNSWCIRLDTLSQASLYRTSDNTFELVASAPLALTVPCPSHHPPAIVNAAHPDTPITPIPNPGTHPTFTLPSGKYTITLPNE